jgi:hypothetical protein
VTDYATSHRLTFYWLREDVYAHRRFEIGARWKRFRKTAAGDYYSEMDASIDGICTALKPGKLLCMVLGESQSDKYSTSVVDYIQELLLRRGFTQPFGRIVRVRSQERVKDRKGSSNPEHILIFQR